LYRNWCNNYTEGQTRLIFRDGERRTQKPFTIVKGNRWNTFITSLPVKRGILSVRIPLSFSLISNTDYGVLYNINYFYYYCWAWHIYTQLYNCVVQIYEPLKTTVNNNRWYHLICFLRINYYDYIKTVSIL